MVIVCIRIFMALSSTIENKSNMQQNMNGFDEIVLL